MTKRLILGFMFVSAGTYLGCAADGSSTQGPSGGSPSAGAAGSGQGGATASGGISGSGGAVAAGGTNPDGGTSGASTGGNAGAPKAGGGGQLSSGSGGASGSSSGGTSSGGASGGGTAGAAGALAGMAGRGGMAATAGSTNGGVSGANAGGGPSEDLTAVAASLDGRTIVMPCDRDTSARVCIPRADMTRPCMGTGPSYAGTQSYNEQLTIGGEPGAHYVVTVHVRGLTEGKTYTGGMDRDSSGMQNPADGLYIGGEANNSGDSYNVYFIRTDSPAQYYYLNSVGIRGDTRVRHSLFESDFEFELPVDGGSTVCLVSTDPNTSAIKNCAEPDVSDECNPISLPNLDASTSAAIGAQPYNGQFVGISVVSVRRM